ncbi:OmpA family protein [Flavobacterium seoulense]|uniref:Membrane protein n=1 Tax=Flavobacterium seoulense TaxID=1492738 RepID=A0A066WSX5_9FLAO|nr:OmpA family protein [Flavobacterium seoulense]KDN54094.1 membrane protein [Flavobacterium seoulense]
MIKSALIVFLFVSGALFAQEKKIGTVYFEFNKYNIDAAQEQLVRDFVKEIDTTQLESIQIYGYCDDRGDNDYNLKLSKNRVNTVKSILIANGFDKNKMVIIEGKGRILIDDFSGETLADIRSKNRRVDLLIVKKNSFGKGIYNSLQEHHEVGDRIYLENIFFDLGSSNLTLSSQKELNKIAEILQRNKAIEFEIRGHVCCTPDVYKDAIDRATKERKLSMNRAKSVFRYLISKNVNSLRMSYKGLGNQFPRGRGDDYDRRVEFLITKN